MNDIDNIELRSEKVRKIIGEMPSGFIRYGITIITCILIIVIILLQHFVFRSVCTIFS